MFPNFWIQLLWFKNDQHLQQLKILVTKILVVTKMSWKIFCLF